MTPLSQDGNLVVEKQKPIYSPFEWLRRRVLVSKGSELPITVPLYLGVSQVKTGTLIDKSSLDLKH